MGLFGFLKRKDETAMPDPGSPEFQQMVQGSALPGSAEMGESGWTDVTRAGQTQSIDLRGSGAREEVSDVLRKHGIDPDREGQTIDASAIPGLPEEIMGVLGQHGVRLPAAGGIGGYVGTGSAPPDPIAQVEHLAAKRDAGEITEAEFQAQKKHLLSGDKPPD